MYQDNLCTGMGIAVVIHKGDCSGAQQWNLSHTGTMRLWHWTSTKTGHSRGSERMGSAVLESSAATRSAAPQSLSQQEHSRTGRHLRHGKPHPPHQHRAAQHRAIRRPSPVRALVWRWRWVIVALVFGLVVQSALTTLGIHQKPMNTVVVASHDLSTGTTLNRGEVQLKALPVEAIPTGTLSSLDAALGQILAAPLPAGAPIIDRQLLTSDFAASAPPGTVITAVTLDHQATAAMLRAGDRIQLYSPSNAPGDSSEAQLLTDSALVMSVKADVQDKSILRDSHNKGEIFVAIPKNDASLVIGLGAKVPFHAVIVSQ